MRPTSALLFGTFIIGPVHADAAETSRPWCGVGSLNTAERTICSAPELSRLDARLADVYRALRSDHPGRDKWRRGQRDACGREVVCLRAACTEWLRQIGTSNGG